MYVLITFTYCKMIACWQLHVHCHYTKNKLTFKNTFSSFVPFGMVNHCRFFKRSTDFSQYLDIKINHGREKLMEPDLIREVNFLETSPIDCVCNMSLA